jgi:glycerophosphoryl diester phosphodiesterase
MMLEVKRSKWEDALLAQIATWPNIIVTSFDHTAIADLAHRGVPFPLGIVTYGRLVDGGAYARGIGATWTCPAYRYVDKDVVGDYHEHGVKVVPWSPDREGEWERLEAAGCDGIITDLPAEAVAWRSAKL